jgi:hypothetical protein
MYKYDTGDENGGQITCSHMLNFLYHIYICIAREDDKQSSKPAKTHGICWLSLIQKRAFLYSREKKRHSVTAELNMACFLIQLKDIDRCHLWWYTVLAAISKSLTHHMLAMIYCVERYKYDAIRNFIMNLLISSTVFKLKVDRNNAFSMKMQIWNSYAYCLPNPLTSVCSHCLITFGWSTVN